MDLESRNRIRGTADYQNVQWTKILDIVIDPADPKNVYAADFSSGIQTSSDAGKTWAPINEGISLRTATCLTISGDGKVLYAGVKGDGVLRLILENRPPQIQRTIPSNADTVTVFRGDTAEFEVFGFDLNEDPLSYTWEFEGQLLEGSHDRYYRLASGRLDPGTYSLAATVSDPDTSVRVNWIVKVREIETGTCPGEGMPSGASIEIFPNPFRHSAEIRYRLPGDSDVDIHIFDLTGKEVQGLATGHRQSGRHTLIWDGKGTGGRSLPTGIYVIRFVYRAPGSTLVQERKIVFSR